MYCSIFTIPLTSSIIVGLFGKYFGKKGSSIIIVLSMFITSIISIICFYEIIYCSSSVSIYILPFIYEDILNVNMGFMFDPVSISFVITIVIVSFNVYVFACNYMTSDPHIIRFLVYMSLFSSSMIYLVIGNSYIQTFIGWEFIGVFSYFLINFWYKRINANMAAIKAFTMNRIGDIFFTIIIICICIVFGDCSYEIGNSLENILSNNVVYYIGITIILASLAKSAQFGFHIWLPFSMEGIYIYNII